MKLDDGIAIKEQGNQSPTSNRNSRRQGRQRGQSWASEGRILSDRGEEEEEAGAEEDRKGGRDME
jgi:hypothetical protein